MPEVQFDIKFDLATIWRIFISLRIARVLIGVVGLCVAGIVTLVVLFPVVRIVGLLVVVVLTVSGVIVWRRLSRVAKRREGWGSTFRVTINDGGLLLVDSSEQEGPALLPWSDFPTTREHSAFYELCGADGASGPVLPKGYPLDGVQARDLRQLLVAHTALA
jgi:hypothetical protein